MARREGRRSLFAGRAVAADEYTGGQRIVCFYS